MERETPARLLLCTRDAALAERLSGQLAHWAEDACVDIALTAAGALPRDGEAPDLLLLDNDTVEDVPARRPPWLSAAELVVLSRQPRQAVRACRWHAAALLPAEPSERALAEALDRCFNAWRQGMRWLDLPSKRDRIRLPLCQLQYAEACGRETNLYCAGGSMQASIPLKALEAFLPSPPFYRCQKAFIVRLSAVETLSGGQLVMRRDGRSSSVSRRQLPELRAVLEAWNGGGEALCASP